MKPSEPLAPPPDVKDWTWVLTAPCPDCGFDPAGLDRSQLADRTRVSAARIAGALQRPDATTRPSPQVWSPVEYACHVRDVCRIYAERLRLMRTVDDPLFVNWDQDETAIVERYWEQRPDAVAAELTAAADEIAAEFGSLTDVEWARPGRRSDGAVFTVDTLSTYFLHDLVHHVHDVAAAS